MGFLLDSCALLHRCCAGASPPGPSPKRRGEIFRLPVGRWGFVILRWGRFMLSGAVDGDVSNSSGMVMSFGKLMIMVG